MKSEQNPVLGIDIGRVIINAADPTGKADTSFLSGSEEHALNTPACDGAFEAIRELVDAFDGKVWLVSKCGPRIQQRTLRWLKRQRFYEITGLRQDRVRFCLKRPDKRVHCAAIAASYFVDDRLDVLENLRDLVPNLFWFGHQSPAAQAPEWALRAVTWADAKRLILDRVRS
jgi:hypothetical protein